MVPKPFPFPIEVGIDICRTARIAALLRQEQTRNRWAQRIFTRLEWPAIVRRFQRADRAEGETYGQAMKRQQHLRLAREGNLDGVKDLGQNVWMLPNLASVSSMFEDEELYWSAIRNERSPLGGLARHLAGRWAAKEAVIKAHRHRQLYMHDISIIRQSSNQGKKVTGTRLIALINPICDSIDIDERVASERHLRGFGPRSQGLHKGALIEEHGVLHIHEQRSTVKAPHFRRSAKVRDSDRQIAKINISHDGDYAVAVCMAFDSPERQPERKIIVDDGTGPPKHEPQWGDEGWFDPVDEQMEASEERRIEGTELKDLIEDRNSVYSPEALRDIVEKALEGSEEDELRRLPPLP